MKIPKKIKVNGIIYKIEYVEEINDNIHSADYRGVALIKYKKVNILNYYFEDDKKRTILHEAIHILDDDFKINLNENSVRRLTSGLYAFLKDNKLLKE